MALTDRARLRELLERHGFTFSKAMGQNFLVNPSVCPRMAELGGAAPGVGVLEIGPGVGVLTAELARRAGRVVCVELDPRLPPILAETLAEFDNVEIVLGDVMEVDLQSLIAGHFGGMPVVVCANLPYYITSPVLTKLLESRCFSSITVMVQKEVAQRICAAPASKDYSAFTVLCNYHAQPELLFDVPASCFIPQPKVTSAVVCLKTRETPPAQIDDERLFFRTVRAAFAQRRKTLLNALTSGFGELSKADLAAALEVCGIPAAVRGETLDIPTFAALSNELSRRIPHV